MRIKRNIILGTIFIGTICFWLFVMATYELLWEIDMNWVYSKTIEVNPRTGEKEVFWAGEKIHEELLRALKKYPENEFLKSVDNFGPLRIGGKAPIGIVLHPNKIPSDVQFYVYYHRMGFGMCNNESCAPLEGKVVKCMNGWLAGSDQHEGSYEVGLDHDLVKQGIASIVVVSNKNEKIMGIFPYHTESDIIPILDTFPEFQEPLSHCFEKYLEVLLKE